MNDQLAAVLYHEYAHVLVHFLANRNAPVWLNEGLAELAGRRMFSPPSAANCKKPMRATSCSAGTVLPSLFPALPADKVLLAYEQSYSLVQFMVEQLWLAQDLRNCCKGSANARNGKRPLPHVYREYGLDWPAILKEWQAGLN